MIDDRDRIRQDQLFDVIFPAHLAAQVNISQDGIHQELSLIRDQSSWQHKEDTKARKEDNELVDWLGQEGMEVLKKYCG